MKRLFVSGKLTPSNSNELQKMCKEFIVEESACKSFVQHRTKRVAERNTLPNIDWNDEHQVSSLTANKLILYLNRHHLQVSGGKAALVARFLRYVRAGQDLLEAEGTDTTKGVPRQFLAVRKKPVRHLAKGRKTYLPLSLQLQLRLIMLFSDIGIFCVRQLHAVARLNSSSDRTTK